jgi:hypothetical protein
MTKVSKVYKIQAGDEFTVEVNARYSNGLPNLGPAQNARLLELVQL